MKITDFGIAKIDSSNLTTEGQFLGTPNYMSPEQVTGEVVDGRSDIFSLGVVLYEMLTRKKPFAGENLTSISYKIVHEPYPPPQTYDAAIPAEFNPILARALAKDPAARFQSGRDFVRALSEFRARHAEMEMLKDLGEMVAQAERLGSVSAVESKESLPPAQETIRPRPGPSAARPGGARAPRRRKHDARGSRPPRAKRSRPVPGRASAALTQQGDSIPDWSLDTDSLKRNSVNARDEGAGPHEPPPSSPGTLVSDVKRGSKPATDRDSGASAPRSVCRSRRPLPDRHSRERPSLAKDRKDSDDPPPAVPPPAVLRETPSGRRAPLTPPPAVTALPALRPPVTLRRSDAAPPVAPVTPPGGVSPTSPKAWRDISGPIQPIRPGGTRAPRPPGCPAAAPRRRSRASAAAGTLQAIGPITGPVPT